MGNDRIKYFFKKIENESGLLLNLPQVIIVGIDKYGIIRLVNKFACELLGLDKEKLIGLNWFDNFIPKAIRKEIKNVSKQIIDGKIDFVEFYENKIINKKGKVLLISWHNVALYDEQGNIFGHISAGIDITEKTKKERQLRLLSTAVEQSANTVLLTDTRGIIEYVNPKFTELTGYTYKEAVGKNPRILNAGKLPKSHYKELWDTIKAGKVWKGIFCNKTKDNRIYWEEATITPIKDENGKIIKYLAIKEDITERKRAEEKLKHQKLMYQSLYEEYEKQNKELKKAKLKAEESDRLKSAFLANMSHEIRTPLNSIIGFAELLTTETLDEERRNAYLKIIEESGYQLLSLINDIIDISKIEAKKMLLSEDNIFIPEFLKSIEIFFENEKIKTDKNVEFIVINDLPENSYHIISDSVRLRQIISNLILNALKFTYKGEIILKASLTKDKKFIEFSVKDTGIGITPEKKKIIFDRFRQADETNSKKFGGAGLGLAIVKGLVELFEGEITVNSQVGVGSEFIFTVPYKPQDSVRNENKYQQKNKYDFSGKFFMVVEDDNNSFIIIREMLSSTGATLIHAADAKIAYEILQNTKPDIILLDIRLPEINGIEFAKKIKQKYPKLPILVQSAYAMNNDIKAAKQAGADDYISKPIPKKNF